jgi:hypothetical protein
MIGVDYRNRVYVESLRRLCGCRWLDRRLAGWLAVLLSGRWARPSWAPHPFWLDWLVEEVGE